MRATVLGIFYTFAVDSPPWGISSIGRVRRSQRRGRGIETLILQFLILVQSEVSPVEQSLYFEHVSS